MNQAAMSRILRFGLGVLITALTAFLVAYALSASAKDAGASAVAPGGIVFPVPELGNCADKEACRAYCNDPANIPACVEFAEAHGLMNDDEANRARKFARSVGAGQSPGGCAAPEACKAYCEDVTHLEACVKFADEHGAKLPQNDPGRKLLVYLRSGGTMPGGCTSRDSCETYCKDLSHADECITFAEKAGLTIGGGPGGEDGKKPEDVRRFVQYMKRGETPGACQSKDACEAYCHDQSHFEECAAFAERVGLVKPDEIQKFRELGGKGPGGCTSRESCEAYCREETHREECFRFAEEHGLLPKEELEHAKEGLVRMRAGLENAPPEIAACIKTTLGSDVVERIMRGEFTPGPEIGERLRTCFERFGEDDAPRELFRDAPADVVACLKEKLGTKFDAIRSGAEAPTPEMADTLRVCFAKLHMMREDAGPFMNAEGSKNGRMMAPQDFLQNAPQGIRECVARKLGTTSFPRTTEFTAEAKEELRECFESFKPGEARSAEGTMRAPGTTVPGTGLGRGLAECLVRVKEEVRSRAGGSSDTAVMGQLISELNKKCYAQFGPGEGQSGGSGSGLVPPQPIGPPSREGGSGMPSLTPEAVQCLRARVSASEFENLMRGGKPGPEAEMKIRECLNNFLKDQPDGTQTAPAFPGRTAGDCPQRLTQAQDPLSGACKTFPSPCGVPRGWTLGCSSGSGSEGGVRPFPEAGPCPMMPTIDSCPAGQKKVPAFSSPECGTYYACAPDGTSGSGQQYPQPYVQPDTNTMPPPSSLGPLGNATARMSTNPFEIFVRFLLGL